MLPLLMGLEGSQTRQLPSLPTHPASLPTAATLQSAETVQLLPSQQTLPRSLTRPTLQSMVSLLQLLPLHLILLTILPMSAVRTLSSAHCAVPESACSSTSLRWNSRTAWNPSWLDWTTTWEMWGKKTRTWKLPLSAAHGNSRLLKTVSLNVQFLPLWIVSPECSSTPHQAVPLMHRSWMDRPKQAFCRCLKPLRPIHVQHPFAPPPLTWPLNLPPSTRNNQSGRLQTKQRLIALPTAPYLTSEWTDPDRFLLHCDSLRKAA